MEITITIKLDDKDLERLEKADESNQETEFEYSRYARIFDQNSRYWCKDREGCLTFLKLQEEYTNGILKSRGHIFLNEVYDMLGLPRSKEGQVIGWVYKKDNPIGDNYVDYGLEELYDRGVFKDDSEAPIVLDFNVDGMIWNKI